MMWPFDQAGGGLLALYIATLALHAVLVGYVVGGTVFALLRPRDPLAAIVRDRLPFMLGGGITAGVAPLLFVQLLHQERFYTANLLLGPRWMAVVPALVVGFYALYVAKSSERWRRPALGAALACLAFVAWSWSELHELMHADPAWRDFYAAGQRVFVSSTVPARFVVFGGAMLTSFAMIAAWSADAASRRGLAFVALGARGVSVVGAVWLWRAGFALPAVARGWFVVLAIALVVEAAAWLAVRLQGGSERALAVATGAGTSALVAAAVVREAPRVAVIVPASATGGALAFALVLIGGVAAIAWVVKTLR